MPSVAKPTAKPRIAREPYPLVPATLNAKARALIGDRIEAATATKYEGAWRKYLAWCTKEGMPSLREDKAEMAIQLCNFIADEQDNLNLGTSACKTRVAAVSTRLTLTTGWHLGEDPLVSAVMGGVRKRRPEMPRYEDLPSLDQLWAHFDQLPENEELDQAQLVGKAAAILLTFGLRKCDQVRIDLTGSIVADSMLRLRTLTKETQGRAWVVQPIPAASDHPKRCAVQVVKELIRRKSPNAPAGALFTNRDGTPSTSKWLASCVKKIMHEAGIEARFRPHSLRGAGSTRAIEAGLPQVYVTSLFRWSPTSDVFAHHYFRASNLRPVADAIYGKKTNE